MAGRSGRHLCNSPMLSVCTSRECKAIVFGRGTCIEHDPHRGSHPGVQDSGGPRRRSFWPLSKPSRPPIAAGLRRAATPRDTGSGGKRLAQHPLSPRQLEGQRPSNRIRDASSLFKIVNPLAQFRRHPPTFRRLRRVRDQWKLPHAKRGHGFGNALRPVQPDMPFELLHVRSLRED
jgi:hypothetical protein